MKLYSINKWGELFENNRSRTVKFLDWVSIPNKHDGENYGKMITHKDGAVLFATWNLLVQVASKCKIRGVLIRDDGRPHDSTSLFLKTRAPKVWFDKALEWILAETDWMLVKEVPEGYQEPVSLTSATHHHSDEEGKGREGKEGKGTIGNFPKEVEFWNLNCETLPAVVAINSDRMKRLNQRRQDPFWVANFEKAVIRVRSSQFCSGKNDRQWRADFDWMLQPNVVAKIMEGKYDNRNGEGQPAKPRDPSKFYFGHATFSRERPPRRSDFPDERSFVSCDERYQIWLKK